MESTLISSLKQKGKSFTKIFPIASLTKLLKKSLLESAKSFQKYMFAFYKVGLRPFFGNACKFHPSCSDYSQQAYLRHGILKGTTLTTWRILRCHPFCEGGVDPVPPKNEIANG